MLPKRYRYQESPTLLRQKRHNTEAISLVLQKNHTNFGLRIIVSKKIDKRAVYRNKIRRRVSEVFRTLIINPDKFPYQVVVIVKPGIINIDFKQLSEQIKSAITPYIIKWRV